MSLSAMQVSTIRAGLDWAAGTEQPDGAVLTHHGVTSPSVDRLRFRFTERDGDILVIALRVGVEYDKTRLDWVMLNPITEQEMADVEDTIKAWCRDDAARIVERWNGVGCESGSIQTSVPVTATLYEAFAAYHEGCPTHHTVFCGGRLAHLDDPTYETCRWLTDGLARTVGPAWPVQLDA